MGVRVRRGEMVGVGGTAHFYVAAWRAAASVGPSLPILLAQVIDHGENVW